MELQQKSNFICNLDFQITSWSIGTNSNGNPVLNVTLVISFDCLGFHASATVNISVELKRGAHSRYVIDKDKYNYTIITQSGNIRVEDHIEEIFEYLQ